MYLLLVAMFYHLLAYGGDDAGEQRGGNLVQLEYHHIHVFLQLGQGDISFLVPASRLQQDLVDERTQRNLNDCTNFA